VTAPDTAAVLRFAAALADRSAGLPAPYYDVTPHSPTLHLHVHQGFAAFELWREHLGIPEDEVCLMATASQATMHGTLVTPAGVTVQVTGYSTALPEVAR
jgi:hypothetical protein